MKKVLGVLAVGIAFTALADPLVPAKPRLWAAFTSAPVIVDGHRDAAWNAAVDVPLVNAFDPDMTARAGKACVASASVRALWDGTLLYLLVTVRDPDVTPKDGVEFWVDHFNDKAAKFQEDDGMFAISAPPPTIVANRSQNTLYDNVSSRYLESHASALQADGADQITGYNVEIAWHLGEHAPTNGTRLGFDFGVNEADAGGTLQCRLYWTWNGGVARTTNDSRGWGTVTLAGRKHQPLPADEFMLRKNLDKADALTRGIWRDERKLDAAVQKARTQLGRQDRGGIERANGQLESALRGLRRTGPYPDPHDLPVVRHLHDPFQFFDGKRVKSREDWDRRREEIKALMQYYEFGVMPAKPPVLTAASTTRGNSRDITIQMSTQGRSASFAPRLTLPTPAQAEASGKSAPFPLIVSLDFRLNDGNANYLDAGYAVLSIPARDVHSDNIEHKGPIFELYPYDVAKGTDFGSLLGWAWSASRAVEALEYLAEHDAEFKGLLDPHRIAVSGFSRMGKAALLTGMLDERFAVTHAGASGSGGAAPYRFVPFGHEYAWGFTDGSETLGDHVRHQTHNSNEMMRRFLNDTVPAAVQPRMYLTRTFGYGERLPFDHHLEIAAIAPRAVLIANTNDDYGNNAEGDALGVMAARPVFEFLGAGDKLALDLYMGGGGHSLKLPQQHNFVRFLDHVLYGVPLPATPPPGDATHTPTNLQLRRDPYLTGTPDRRSVYDTFYRGARFLMPWLGRVPGPADSQRQ